MTIQIKHRIAVATFKPVTSEQKHTYNKSLDSCICGKIIMVYGTKNGWPNKMDGLHNSPILIVALLTVTHFLKILIVTIA